MELVVLVGVMFVVVFLFAIIASLLLPEPPDRKYGDDSPIYGGDPYGGGLN